MSRTHFEGSLAIAEHWLHLWADCLRARDGDESGRHRLAVKESRSAYGAGSSAAPYATGAPDSGMFRPADDPRPMAFVFLQVERLLGPQEGVRWRFAEHVWKHRRPVDTFADPALSAQSRIGLFRMRRALIARLARSIALRAPETISQAAVEEARERIRLERQR